MPSFTFRKGQFRIARSKVQRDRFFAMKGGSIIHVDENEIRKEANKHLDDGISFIKRRTRTSNIKFIR